MMHTKKIMLVPYDMAKNKKKPAVLSKLNKKVQNILQNKSIPADIKLVSYNQSLQQYNMMKKNQKKPYEIAFKEMMHPLSDDAILKNVPKMQLKKATKLLNFIKASPLIDISTDGKVSVNGETLKDANIISLVSDFTKNVKSNPVEGAVELADALKNIPLEFIGNKNRHNLFIPESDEEDSFLDWEEHT